MKKYLKKIIFLIIVIVTIYILSIFINNYFEDYFEKSLKNYDWVEDHVEIVKSGYYGDNIYQVEKNKRINYYDSLYQKAIDENIGRLKSEDDYLFTNPLLILNPYGTNKVGLNIYFTTEEETKISYTIRVKSTDDIP